MTLRAYFWIVLAVLAGALVVGVLPRTLRSPRTDVSGEPAPSAVELSFVWTGTALEPATSEVALGRRVRIVFQNHGAQVVSIALAGYEDRARCDNVAPGATAPMEFTADRPGEAFAWTVNGEPAGRLAVAGSHLVENHR